jgi:hypothetical protein
VGIVLAPSPLDLLVIRFLPLLHPYNDLRRAILSREWDGRRLNHFVSVG